MTQALDRIRQGVEALQSGGDSKDVDALRRALEEEKTANAQLEERVRAIRQRQDEKVADMERHLSAQTDQLAAFEQECGKLRRLVEDLRSSNVALREANMKGLGDAHLINKAMLAELETLRATRTAETAEVGAVLSALEPLLAPANEEAADA